MGIEIPKGNDVAPEQAKVITEVQKEPSNGMVGWKKWIVPGLALLVVAAVLIACIPDWNEQDDKNQGTTIQHESTLLDHVEGQKDSQILFFESSKGPFDVKIPLFSSRVTEGYNSTDELKKDLYQLAGFLLNDAITSNQDAGEFSYGYSDGGDMMQPTAENEKGDVAETAAAPSGGSGALENVDAYETNNQEFSIDRADVVKSDGSLVFAAYTDYLLVWATDGPEIITKIQMRPLNITDYYNGPRIEPMPMPMDTTTENSAAEADVGDAATSEKVSASARSWMWTPKPRIEALLIHENRLTVVISGYGMENVQNLGYIPILYEYLGTRIQVYDINDGDLQLVAETDVNGGFRNAYSVEENVYVVTQSNLNTWEHLLAPVQRWQPYFIGLDDDAYLRNVTALADEDLVNAFIDRLLAELQVNGEIDLARLSVFSDAISEDHADESLYMGGIANAITQVISFDMTMSSSTVKTNGVGKLLPQVSGTFHPGSWGQVYAMGSMIIVADQGWSWIEADGKAAQKTYLVCFRLDGPSSTHAMVGSVDGSLLNPYSLDYVEKSEGSYVRIATTQTFWTPWFGIMEGDMMTTAEEPDTEVVESNTINQIIVLRVPSTTDTSGDHVLEQVGSLQLGEPNEVFTAVRFFDDFAYAVTFERVDPFYVIDLTKEQPVKAGELKVSGFSQYLHAIDANDQYLVAVGQDSDNDGNILGLQISLFDATTASSPTLIDRLVVEQNKNTWSDSSVAWDERAFRFVSLGDRKGKVIIPLSMYTWQEFDPFTGEPLSMPQEKNFEGFSVFNIENDVITKDFDVDHSFEISDSYSNCYFWYEWLPERSFVFNGKLMTMKKYTIISTDLSTGETLWTLPINNPVPVDCED